MPEKTREDDFLEKLADLLRSNRGGDEPVQSAAGEEGENEPLAVDAVPASEPALSQVAEPSSRPGS